jgi:hypothetical protein
LLKLQSLTASAAASSSSSSGASQPTRLSHWAADVVSEDLVREGLQRWLRLTSAQIQRHDDHRTTVLAVVSAPELAGFFAADD